MREKKTTEHSQSPDFELCGACGAVLEKDAKFCNRCGVRLETPAEEKADAHAGDVSANSAPADEAAVVEESAEAEAPTETEISNKAETSDDDGLCKVCGAVLEENANFCNICGARVQAHAEDAAAVKRFCMNCGSDVTDVKFCTNCGVAVGEVNAAACGSVVAQTAASIAVNDLDPKSKKKRGAGIILYLMGACISVIFGLVFLCTAFMDIQGSSLGSFDYWQSGISLIGAMFGAHSEFVEAGVNATLLGWIGWLYFALLIAIINHAVCVALNIPRYTKGERPYDIVQSSLALFLFSILLLLFGCLAHLQAEAVLIDRLPSYGFLKCYLGFIGVFVVTFIGFGFVLAGYLVSNKTFPPRDRRAKKTGNVLIIFIVDLVCAVLIAVFSIAPAVTAFSYNHDKEIEVRVGESGKAATDCDEEHEGITVGATVFKLEGMEYGEDYIFRIETNDVGEYALVGAVSLVYYDDVEDLSAAEILDTIYDIYIDSNDKYETGDGYAYLSFTKISSKDMAIVVGFTATGDMTVKYEYSFMKK